MGNACHRVPAFPVHDHGVAATLTSLSPSRISQLVSITAFLQCVEVGTAVGYREFKNQRTLPIQQLETARHSASRRSLQLIGNEPTTGFGARVASVGDEGVSRPKTM